MTAPAPAKGQRPAASALPTRFRFASSGSAPSARSTGDLEETLRRRLRLVATLFALAFAAQASGSFWRILSGNAGDSVSVLTGAGIFSALWTPFLIWLSWRLAPARPTSLVQLRRFEVLALLAYVGLVILTNILDFPTVIAILPVAPIDLAGGSTAQLSFGLVAYGVLIPNTWRRCSMIVLGILVMVSLPYLYLLPHYHVDRATAFTFMATRGTQLVLSAALAVFGSYRIERSEAAAREAQQLGQYILRERLGTGGMGEVPVRVRAVRAEVSEGLDAIVMRALAKRPEDRFASAGELEAALAAVVV